MYARICLKVPLRCSITNFVAFHYINIDIYNTHWYFECPTIFLYTSNYIFSRWNLPPTSWTQYTWSTSIRKDSSWNAACVVTGVCACSAREGGAWSRTTPGASHTRRGGSFTGRLIPTGHSTWAKTKTSPTTTTTTSALLPVWLFCRWRLLFVLFPVSE